MQDWVSLEERALALLPQINDVARLRIMLGNVRGQNDALERAVFDRLITVAAGQESEDPLARDFWKMIFAVEELRRLAARPVWRMNRLRPKVANDGAEAALAYCALHKTDGFEEVIGYGRPDLLAESIALRYPDRMSEEVLTAARKRLEEHGVA